MWFQRVLLWCLAGLGGVGLMVGSRTPRHTGKFITYTLVAGRQRAAPPVIPEHYLTDTKAGHCLLLRRELFPKDNVQ